MSRAIKSGVSLTVYTRWTNGLSC